MGAASALQPRCVRKITKNICFLTQNKGQMHFFSKKIALFSHFCLFF